MQEREILRVWLPFAVAVTVGGLGASGLALSFEGAGPQIGICAICLLVGCFYKGGSATFTNRMTAALHSITSLGTVSILGGAISYATARLSNGYVDSNLAWIDSISGLSWMHYWKFVHDHAIISNILTIGYLSIFIWPAIMLTALCLLGHERAAYRLILAFAVSLILTDIIFLALPSKSAAIFFLGDGAADLPPAGSMHIPIIEALRSGTLNQIPIGHLTGLINFPSFHAASAALFIWASWMVRWIRYPSLVINSAMLAATPVNGGHFFIDLVAGVAVAGIGISFVSPAVRLPKFSEKAFPRISKKVAGKLDQLA